MTSTAVTSAALDANTIVSANLVAEGIPSRVLQAARAGRFRLVTSRAIVDEVVRTLRAPRIRRKYHVTDEDVERVRHLLEVGADLVTIVASVVGVATHPEDDLILATAVSGQADYLVTGDRQLLALGSFRGVAIVSPREFLALLTGTDVVWALSIATYVTVRRQRQSVAVFVWYRVLAGLGVLVVALAAGR